MRIAQYLARCGVASRRKSEEIIREGQVRLNGEVVLDLGRQVDTSVDQVTVDGKKIALSSQHLTLVLNKPAGVVVTRSDPEGRRTVYDLLPEKYKARSTELVYAGRLDLPSRGLLLLTTDGDLVNELVHPRHHVEKTYHVRTDAAFSDKEIQQLQSGIDIGDAQTLPCDVKSLSRSNGFWYEIVLREGRNRQIRRMVESAGGRVLELERVAIGRITLERLNLGRGQWRELRPEDIKLLKTSPR